MKLEEAIQQHTFKSEEEKLIINLNYTSSWLMHEQTLFFKRFGISAQQYNVLRILKGQGEKPASVSLIQERMLDRMSNASRLIEKLKQKGLVQRKECPKDRRQVDVEITPKGVELLVQIDLVQGEMNKVCDKLNLREKQTMNELLDKIRKN